MAALDKGVARRVKRAVERFADTGAGSVKRLQGIDPPENRLRVGDYRVRAGRHCPKTAQADISCASRRRSASSTITAILTGKDGSFYRHWTSCSIRVLVEPRCRSKPDLAVEIPPSGLRETRLAAYSGALQRNDKSAWALRKFVHPEKILVSQRHPVVVLHRVLGLAEHSHLGRIHSHALLSLEQLRSSSTATKAPKFLLPEPFSETHGRALTSRLPSSRVG
jgi:hypothetical protein